MKHKLLGNIKSNKLTYFCHTKSKHKERKKERKIQDTTSGLQAQGRQRTAWSENKRIWMGLTIAQ